MCPKIEDFSIEASNGALKIRCKVSGNPVPTVKLYREENELKSDDRVTVKHYLDTSKAVSVLTMSSLGPNDEGTYRCTGSNTFFNGSFFQDSIFEEVVILGGTSLL